MFKSTRPGLQVSDPGSMPASGKQRGLGDHCATKEV